MGGNNSGAACQLVPHLSRAGSVYLHYLAYQRVTAGCHPSRCVVLPRRMV
jgi:hypothetical protein